jgi:RNA polymerase sigma-70 factor (ECF subfamily)
MELPREAAVMNEDRGSPMVEPSEGDSWRSEYDELCRVARFLLKREAAGHTLQGTALVHEAYLRISASGEVAVNREHFFRRAAQVLRHALVDHARARKSGKRGGLLSRIPIEQADAAIGRDEADCEAISAAMDELAKLNPRHAEVVGMKFFAGYTHEQIAACLGVSLRTVESDWNRARAWLAVRLKGADS